MTEVSNHGRIRSWKEAIRRNFTLCRPEALFTRMTPKARADIDPFVDFVQDQSQRRFSPEVMQGWQVVTTLRSRGHNHYEERSTPPEFYFSPRFAGEFSGARVLDIGCRVKSGATPFYRHFKQMGADTTGVDILTEDQPNDHVFKGDARMLPFPDGSFDFVTLPLVYGHNNPSNTVLEVAAGFSELSRVTTGPALVHIADSCVFDELTYVAQRFGWRWFRNPITRSRKHVADLPVGSFLAKKTTPISQNRFLNILSQLLDHEIDI